MKKTRKALLSSLVALFMSITMLIGSTFAWFTDNATSSNNIIQSGNLDLKMYWTDDLTGGQWYDVEDPNHNTIFNYDNWEPGYTEVRYIKIENAGNLAFNYNLAITPVGEVGKLAEVINVFCGSSKDGIEVKSMDDLSKLRAIGLLNNVMNGKRTANGTLLAKDQYNPSHNSEDEIITIAMNMITTAGNEYQGKSVGDGFKITALATQCAYEEDSFGSSYDSNATYPDIVSEGQVSSTVTTENGKVADGGIELTGEGFSANVPEGVELEDGVDRLTLTVTPLEESATNITTVNQEILIPVDVHISGVSKNNTTPIIVNLGAVMPKYLNMGNYTLYHVEDGENVTMTYIGLDEEFTAHNQFKYDPATGELTLAMVSFSEVAVVADTSGAWKGEFDYSWYESVNNKRTNSNENTEYTIANADQLAGFGAIVGGMNGQTRDTFEGKTVKLLSDIDLDDENNANNLIFHPIGYCYINGDSTVKSFEGTFDGQGHTISNFYQNTWEIEGDYDGTYYKDAMGLFGYVANGAVKNLTVDNFSSDGEFTPTGVIAAYAVNSTFENIAITNCNPRVYNTGNGGIIGIAGRENETVEKIALKNITVDNSNKISALWGSWDVACGGLVGMYRGNVDGSGNKTGDTISFENCHVSAQIDVYNDVCANYQYYAYRYAGMIIGSIRHNTTNDDGKTIPNMTGVSASGCTVNYGDWNDYYYCEFEKNSMASYSEDYQFSRVDKSEIISDENGTRCTHTHTDAEDKRAINLPFYQLFTGYSWGVSSIGLKEYEGITNQLDIAEGEYTGSVTKFNDKEVKQIETNKKIKASDLFSYNDSCGIKVDNAAFYMGITNMDKDGKVTAIFTSDNTSWSDSTIEFKNIGKITITVQDYYFCTPTTIEVEVVERQEETKFESKFTGDFLYRVGNENVVSLNSLFEAKDGVEINNSDTKVIIESVDENSDVSGTFTADTTNWTQGTIQFSGTGVVKVTIQDDDFCTPTELYLEVVDAKNLTSSAGTTTGGTFVLLSDVNTSSHVNYWNCTLYGNGFTYSLKGAPTAYNSKQGHGILITKNATLDNLVIVGDVYNSYGAYTVQDYYNTAIDVVGDTTIQNCYIANCAAPVKARSNVTIKNTTLHGGAVANLLIMSGTATLENVTTANYDDGRALVGMGIVIHSDATETAKLVLNGTLTQYNFISESKVPTDTYAKNLHDAMFSSDCSQYQFGTSPNRYVNTGIISLTSTFNREDITDNAKTGYVGKSLRVSSYDGYVYTQANTSGNVNNNFDKYNPTTQGEVPPSYSFDYTNKNYIAKTDGSNDYCYEENGKVNISMDEGDTFNWDTSILTIGKGITNYTVSMNGTDYTGKSIAFNTAGDYTVTYTYADNNNIKYDENKNITTYSVTYTKEVNITVAVVKATTKHAEFTFGSSNTASTTVTVGNSTYVMPNVSGTSSTIGSTTVSGQTIYYPIVEIIMSDGKTSHSSGWYAYFPVFSGAVTITDYANNGTGDKMTPYNGSTTTMPSGLSIVGDPTQLFKYQSSSAAGSTPVVKSNKLVYSSAKIEAKRSEYNTVIQYSYTDNAGATYYYYIGYHAPAQSYSTTCVTPDTLVTLADGSQKEVQHLTGEEQLLVWNHTTGRMESAPVAYIVNHDKEEKEVEIIQLYFSNGKEVEIIGEHVFFNSDLNKYITLDENAEQYVGQYFAVASPNNKKLTTAMLTKVEKEIRKTAVYEVVTYQNITCFTNDILSASAYMDKILNVFDINPDTMSYSLRDIRKDIKLYGLYSYENFKGLISKEAFEMYNAKYLKIAVGKGYIKWEDILDLIDVYFNVDVQPLQ